MFQRLFLLAVLLVIPQLSFAATEGPLSPSTAVDDSSIGTVVWTSPSNVTSSDNADADFNPTGFPVDSHYLKATNFGFAIPSGATIDGIVVEVEKGRSSAGAFIDNAVRIVKGGTIGTTDKSSVTAWPSIDTYVSHGGSTDLWGETWAVSDINGSTFGFAISAEQNDEPDRNGYIDHIRITVYYTEAVPDLHEWAMIFLVIGGVYFLYREGMLDGMMN
jgi:hypothetical protein